MSEILSMCIVLDSFGMSWCSVWVQHTASGDKKTGRFVQIHDFFLANVGSRRVHECQAPATGNSDAKNTWYFGPSSGNPLKCWDHYHYSIAFEWKDSESE